MVVPDFTDLDNLSCSHNDQGAGHVRCFAQSLPSGLQLQT